jgi:predicted aldo/keto reductase-like oxidoreductase
MATSETVAIPYRTLGRTGEKVSLLGLGGAHIGKQDTEEESIRLAKTAKLAEGGRLERYKTSDHFDTTVHRPQYLG